MGFAEVAEMAFSTGPQWAKKFAKPSRLLALFFEHIINSFSNLLNFYKFLFRLLEEIELDWRKRLREEIKVLFTRTRRETADSACIPRFRNVRMIAPQTEVAN